MRVVPFLVLLSACFGEPGPDSSAPEPDTSADPDSPTDTVEDTPADTPEDTAPSVDPVDTDDTPDDTDDTLIDPPEPDDTFPSFPDVDSILPGELVIVELMINPTCVDDDGEYVELIWIGPGPVDLRGLILADAQGAVAIDDHRMLQPGERVVMWREPRAGSTQCFGLYDGLAYGPTFALSNSADVVTLRSPTGTVIDSVNYAGWSIPEGASLELSPGRETLADRSDPAYWCSAVSAIPGSDELGTPGTSAGAAVGPCEPAVIDTDPPDTDPAIDTDPPAPPISRGELVINGLLANPESPCDDNDGEWFSFVNVTDRPIDLRGAVIRDESSSWTIPGSYVVAPGAEAIAWHDRGGVECHGFTDGVPFNRASLSNTNGDTISLVSNGVVVDEFTYEDSEAVSGVGWELDPSALDADENDRMANWCRATAPIGATPDLGTPGSPNARCFPAVDTGVDTDTVLDTDTVPVDTDTVDTVDTVPPDTDTVVDTDTVPADTDTVVDTDTTPVDTDPPAQPTLVLSEVASTSATSGRYLEVWNPGPDPVDLTGWGVQIYYNGSTVPDTRALSSVVLGVGDTWVVAYSAAGFQTAWGFPADQNWGSIVSNGDDVYTLVYDRGAGWEVIDVYGEIGVDGTGTAWEFASMSAERNLAVTAPSATFDLAQWTLSPTFTPGSHAP